MEWLRKLLEGAKIVDGNLDVEALMKEVNTEFPKNAVPKETFNDINGQLKTANTTIADLKKNNADNETLQQTIKNHEATIKKLEGEALNTSKTYVLKDKLKEMGATDPDYLIYKHGGIDKFNWDKDGKLIGLEDTVKPYKDSIPHIFKVKPGYNPTGGNGGGAGVNPFAKETFNLTEQGKLLRDNPAQAKEMAAAAGVNI